MQRRPAPRLLAIGVLSLLLALLALAPGQAEFVDDTSQHIIEDFEDTTFPNFPTSPYYSLSVSGSVIIDGNGANAFEGSKSLKLTATAGATASATFTLPGANFCADNRQVTMAVRYTPEPSNAVLNFGLSSSTGSSFIRTHSQTGGSTVFNTQFAGASGPTVTGTAIISQSATYTTIGFACQGTTAQGFNAASSSTSGVLTSSAASLDRLVITAGSGSSYTVYVDYIDFGAPNPLRAFCADPNIINYDGNSATPTTSTGASDDYGYNYRRGGNFVDQSDDDQPATAPGLSTGFFYSGTSTESTWDYSAKSFSTGTKALHENVTIEAGTEGTSSRFRVNLHTATGSNADDTAKGNGLNTGHFADHVEAEFTESGNTWSLQFWYVTAGGARTTLGGSRSFGDANDATQFTVWIDTRSSANAIATLDARYQGNWYTPGGGATHADPFVMVTTASASNGPGGEEIAVLGIQYLDDISGNPFVDDTVGDVWNVGYGTSALLGSTTAVDEDLQENRANTDDEGGLDSTCIFDDAGTMVLAGSQGATPESQLPETPDDSGDDDGPADGSAECGLASIFHLDCATGPFLLGLFYVAMFAGAAYEMFGQNPGAAGAGAIGGFIFAVVADYIPDWIVGLLIAIVMALLFVGAYKNRGG